MRDYVEWHREYDDPAHSLSWRLGRVQQRLRDELDRRGGPLRIVSVCAGDGRDVIGVLRDRADAGRVSATLVELHPDLAAAARTAAATLPDVEVRTADAGSTDAYAGAVPADILVVVGVFGNISDTDVEQLVRAVPALCAPQALIIWSRGTAIALDGAAADLNADVRRWLTQASCTELAYEVFDGPSTERPALGTARFTGSPTPLVPGRHLFTFLR